MAHRASLVPYEQFWCIFQKNAPLGAQERGLVREGLCLTGFLDPKDAEYNPAVKDLNCDFKPSNYAPWGLEDTHLPLQRRREGGSDCQFARGPIYVGTKRFQYHTLMLFWVVQSGGNGPLF